MSSPAYSDIPELSYLDMSRLCPVSSSVVADGFAAGLRPIFDRHATRTRHVHAGLRPGRLPGLRLDSVMVFGLQITVQDCTISGKILFRLLEMWANAQRHSRPAEYRWRPLFNAAKFG